MKILISFISILTCNVSFASGGYTWLGGLVHETHIPTHIIHFIVVALLMLVGGFIYRSKVASVPNAIIPDRGISFRNITEGFAQFIYDQCKTTIGEKEATHFFPMIFTFFIVILISNLMGLVPGLVPPTGTLNTTFALGIFSFIYYNYIGCKIQGTVNYFKHFAGPLWYMAVLIFPIEIVSNFVRPVSLALRLKSNIQGDHLVVAIFSDLVPYGVPIIFLALGLLVAFIQAYVFTILSMVYINLVVAHHDHDDAHAH